MTGGYAAEILLVDLGSRKIDSRGLAPETVRKYLGGSGIAAKMLWDETGTDTEPFSGGNALIFMLGPLTGTAVPSSSRCAATAVSPLTGILGESYMGGTFPRALSRTPYRGIIIKGKADKPVALRIGANGASIADAARLWGKDTFATDEFFRNEVGQKAGIVTIGPAGEKQVKFASIMGDGKTARAFARCGLGAVMGYKKLKAVVVEEDGGRKPCVFDEQTLRASVREFFPRVQFSKERQLARLDRLWHPTGQPVSVKNYSQVEMPGFVDNIRGLRLKSTPCYCRGCRTGCHLSMWVGGRKDPPGQSLEPLGSNCFIDDMEALVGAFELCNRLGLDSISTGQSIAFAMELYEKGLLSKRDCDGIDLVWGNARAMLEMVSKIGNREGIGVLLGEGVRAMAQQIGGDTSDYAMHSKGLEFPRYDPRSNNALALQYATSSRGACHNEGWLGVGLRALHTKAVPYALPYLASKDAQNAAHDLLAVKGTPELVAWSQNYCSVLDSLGVCKFLGHPGVWIREPSEPFRGIQPEQFLTWLNHATGLEMSLYDFMKTGERIFTLKRLFNVRRGITKKDDTLPLRILTQVRGGKERDAGNLPPLEAMRSEYYRLRGWSEDGIPTREKLSELNLEDL